MFSKQWVVQCRYPDGRIIIFNNHRFRSFKQAQLAADITEVFCFERTGEIWILTPVQYKPTS